MMRLYFTLILFYSSQIFALGFGDATHPELMPSGRALALGNAFISRVNDNSAPFYNPAGLGSVRRFSFQLSNIFVETNKGLYNAVTGNSFNTFYDKLIDGFDLNSIREGLAEESDGPVRLNYAVNPNITFQYFSLGYMANQQIKAEASGTSFNYADRLDHGPYISLAIPFFGGIAKLGATAIYLTRKQAVATTNLNQEFEVPDEEFTKGTMTNLIVGAKLTLPVVGYPTFSATVHNAGKAKMKVDKQDSDFSLIKRSVAVGLSISPKIGRRADMNIEVNYRDLGKKYGDIEESRKIAAGIEFSFARQFFIRAGLSEGFGSFGLGLKNAGFMMDFTTYATDLAESGYKEEEDRRFLLTFSIGG